MGRPGIEPDKIREVISELESEGTAVSVTPIRKRLGSGSYSTIGVVLAAWRKEQAEAVLPTVPAIPERVSHLVGHLWAEAWRTADSNHEPERQAFQRERAEHEQLRAEMGHEIARLEAELSRVEAERESARAALRRAVEELEGSVSSGPRPRPRCGRLRPSFRSFGSRAGRRLRRSRPGWSGRLGRRPGLEELAKAKTG